MEDRFCHIVVWRNDGGGLRLTKSLVDVIVQRRTMTVVFEDIAAVADHFGPQGMQMESIIDGHFR